MWWKVLGAAVVLALLGAAGGYAVALDRADRPLPIGSTAPVPAQSPAAPTIAPVTCLPDPAVPALEPGLPASPQTLTTGRKRGYSVELDVPDGWSRTNPSQGQWHFGEPPLLYNTYVMRVGIVASLHVAADLYLRQRIAALRSAQANGALDDFTVQSEAGDTFVATYSAGGYCRVTIERVLALGTPSAYVDLAVTGREEDRQGMLDLMSRTAASMVAGG